MKGLYLVTKKKFKRGSYKPKKYEVTENPRSPHIINILIFYHKLDCFKFHITLFELA